MSFTAKTPLEEPTGLPSPPGGFKENGKGQNGTGTACKFI